MAKVEFDEQFVDRDFSANEQTTDWTPFPLGYGILLNERYQFPVDMALARMKLDASRQLFVDNHVIAHMQGVTRRMHSAKDHPANPIFEPYAHYAMFICPDDEHGYRMYYNSRGNLLHVAYSRDGIAWDLPALNLVNDWGDPQRFPGGPNNVVGESELHGLFYEPHERDPDRRWKAIVKGSAKPPRHQPWPYLPPATDGPARKAGTPYLLHVSPDGYRWRFESETNHWIGPSCDAVMPDQPALGGGDVFRARWDPKLGKYIGNTKHRIGPDYRLSPVFNAARVVGQVESDDLIHWSSPRIYAYPDTEDAKAPRKSMHGIYEADGFPYESMWFNCFSMSYYMPATEEDKKRDRLMTSRPYVKRNHIRLAASRDGRHWHYLGDRGPFINWGDAGSWKQSGIRMTNRATVGGPIVKQDELWFYYRGSTMVGAKAEWRLGTGLATLRRDGFASLDAGDEAGLVITRPFIFTGEGRLFVNARVQAGGELRAAVVEEDTAEPIEHFKIEDSVPFTGDATRHPMRWRQRDSLTPFREQKRYVRIAFHLRQAMLFAFWVE